MKNKHYLFSSLLIVGLLLSLSSCTVDIHPDGANSISAILAVIFEYCWVIIVLFASLIFRLLFISGVGLTTWSLFHLIIQDCIINEPMLKIIFFIGVGLCIIGLLLTPKIQLPYVRISKKPLPAQPENKNVFCWKTKLYEGIIGLIFSVIAEIIIRIIL